MSAAHGWGLRPHTYSFPRRRPGSSGQRLLALFRWLSRQHRIRERKIANNIYPLDPGLRRGNE